MLDSLMPHGWFHSLARATAVCLLMLAALSILAAPVVAQDGTDSPPAGSDPGLVDLVRTGGVVGGVIFALSLCMVYLIVEHLLGIRRKTLVPEDLAAAVHRQITERKFEDARQQCQLQPCFLSHVLASGLSVIDLGYPDADKAMEEAAHEQSARLLRKIEYLHLIGTLAPMLGLLGTVWGMIQAFMEFEAKANPAVSELAPGIYRALVTTMLGLTVAIPAFASFAIFRNRIDELVAEAALTAESVFADFRRDQARQPKKKSRTERSEDVPPRVPSVAIERETQH